MENLLHNFLDSGGFSLSFTMQYSHKKKEIAVDIFGEDEGLLKTRDGRLLLALQTYLNRVTRYRFPDENTFFRLDSGAFFEQKEKKLLYLIQKLKKKALSTGQPVYCKSLTPFQRRKVHQFLAEDGQVYTSSIGDGFYKSVCITPKPIDKTV